MKIENNIFTLYAENSITRMAVGAEGYVNQDNHRSAAIYAIADESNSFATVHLVLPVFNGRETLSAIFERLESFDRRIPLIVWVIDDGSTDDSIAISVEASKKLDVRIVHHEERLGLGPTLRSGIRSVLHSATADDVVMVFEPRLSQDIAMINDMLDQIKQGADIVLASRFNSYKRGGRFSLRQMISKGATYALNVSLPFQKDLDAACNYRAYTVRILQEASRVWGEQLIEERDSACLVELLLKLRICEPVIREIPISTRSEMGRAGIFESCKLFLRYLKLGLHFKMIKV